MQTNPPIPTLEEVQQIIEIDDPIIRNLRITQCYHELSSVLTRRIGLTANWCTFATWASKQAGQTIRREDLARLLESRLMHSPSAMRASKSLAATASTAREDRMEGAHEQMLRAEHFMTAIDRASDAVSWGNKKVFEEIGYEFARFYDACILDQDADDQKITRFCEDLCPGDPPDGQSYLSQAFAHYYQALFEQDAKTKAELILLANIEIGFHEQTRLQPEIAESLDAGFIDFLQYARSLFRSILPMSGWYQLSNLYIRRLLGRPTALDLEMQNLLAEMRSELRQAITEIMMTISLPSGVRLELSRDLTLGFPESLRQITNPDLSLLLGKFDLTPDSLIDSGALNWADLGERLHFIIDLFRCYQEDADLFEAPFTAEQVVALKDGKLPTGRL
jgi:hypothetical protein